MKILTLITALSTIALVSLFLSDFRQPDMCDIHHDGVTWRFEQARTHVTQTRGLMGRRSLCENCGMLFHFENEKILHFWMKDTLIPLDIYFYDVQGRLVDTALNMRPEGETKEPMTRSSKKPAQYAIEVMQGAPFPAETIDISLCQ
ncbi:DUF192 domain-containing protein [Candidatus Gracilibacteria bacterium]|nr:DUF192 domain-containing protein [Candidatus Gracilibacteria bacterium]